jgi:hypothetical protein
LNPKTLGVEKCSEACESIQSNSTDDLMLTPSMTMRNPLLRKYNSE